jgi:hypothetical protein
MLFPSFKIFFLTKIMRKRKYKSWYKPPASRLKRDHISMALIHSNDIKTNSIELEIISFEGLPAKKSIL